MTIRIENRELVYEGAVTTGYRVDLRMPDGHLVRRDLIHFSGAAVVLPVLDDGSIVLIRNYRFAVGEVLWEIPAGGLAGGEDPAVCASRELTEETGYTAGRIEKLGEFYACPGATDEMLYAYLATDLVRGEQNLELYEEISVEVCTERAVRRMVADGTIHDAKTIATLALYWMSKET
ncbi:MAG: NUDIX hydrolase [Phycisphaerae bacterium]|nr:NUDIX hydrolase [Phycisphaerae bacterium]